MIDKMLDKLVKYFENRARKKMGGIPLMNIIYKPEQDIPNVVFNVHPSLAEDEYLITRFQEIADYFRENHSHEWD